MAHPKNCNGSTLADWLGLSRQRVSQLEQEGVFQRDAKGYFDLKKSVSAYIESLKSRNPEATPEESNKQAVACMTAEAELRLTKARADKAELEAAKIRGELVSLEEVQAAWTALIGNAKLRLLSLPTKLAGVLLGLEKQAEIESTLKGAINDALRELSDTDVEISDPEASLEEPVDDSPTGHVDAESIQPAPRTNSQRMGRQKSKTKPRK